jgi:hypothetical protein
MGSSAQLIQPFRRNSANGHNWVLASVPFHQWAKKPCSTRGGLKHDEAWGATQKAPFAYVVRCKNRRAWRFWLRLGVKKLNANLYFLFAAMALIG